MSTVEMNIRNFFLTASVEEMENEIQWRRQRNNGKDCEATEALQKMIQTCHDHGVSNYGDVPFSTNNTR